MKKTDWPEVFQPLIKQYRGRKHPLDYQNRYQLTVSVILSAQDSDKHINEIAPDFFRVYPSIKELAMAEPADLYPYLNKVRNFGNKCKWLTKLAKTLGTDEQIPSTMEKLTELSGIGRKSANVIIRESGGEAEGIIVDLHVVRVAPRLGVAVGDKPDKIEKQLMESLPKNMWGEAGMAISFLGREVCRPTNPKCEECVMNSVCAYFNSEIKGK
ncbi:endonuclease III [bacterium]|nr:MAG: endonuclease III [bacterium]